MNPIKLIQIHYEDGTSEKIFSEGINPVAFNSLTAKVRQKIINQDVSLLPHSLGGITKNQHFSDSNKPKLTENINAIRITADEKEFIKHSVNVCQTTESHLIRCMIQNMIVQSNRDGIVQILAPYLWNQES